MNKATTEFITQHQSLLVQHLEEQNQQQRQQSNHKQQHRLAKQLFTGCWLAFTAWLLVWALGMADTSSNFGSFMLYGGSSILAGLLLIAALAFLWLSRWQQIAKQAASKKANKSKNQPQLLPLFVEQCFPQLRFETQQNQFEQWLKSSRLLKLHEYSQLIGKNTIALRNENGAVHISPLVLEKKDKNQKMQQSLAGVLLRMPLFEPIEHNMLLFAIKNQEQYFENVSLNNFVLGESQVKRLAKRHDQAISSENVDEFNKNFLLAGRNLNKLDDILDDRLVGLLLDLLADYQHNIRLEIDGQQLLACVAMSPNLLLQNLKAPNPQALGEQMEANMEQILQLSERLETIGDLFVQGS